MTLVLILFCVTFIYEFLYVLRENFLWHKGEFLFTPYLYSSSSNTKLHHKQVPILGHSNQTLPNSLTFLTTYSATYL
jgi:hypothetical protein